MNEINRQVKRNVPNNKLKNQHRNTNTVKNQRFTQSKSQKHTTIELPDSCYGLCPVHGRPVIMKELARSADRPLIPTVLREGCSLLDAENMNKADPGTLPPNEQRLALGIGDLAKICVDGSRLAQFTERVWLLIVEKRESIHGVHFVGLLYNELLSQGLGLRLFDPIEFGKEHILDIVLKDCDSSWSEGQAYANFGITNQHKHTTPEYAQN
jgi:hypothetical protein